MKTFVRKIQKTKDLEKKKEVILTKVAETLPQSNSNEPKKEELNA